MLIRHTAEFLINWILQIFVGVIVYIKLLTGLMLVDMILGILAAIKRKEPLSVSKMYPTFLKMIAITALLPAFYHYEEVFQITENHAATATLSSIIGAVQFFTMDKHLKTLFGVSFWSLLLSKVPQLETFKDVKTDSENKSDSSEPTVSEP